LQTAGALRGRRRGGDGGAWRPLMLYDTAAGALSRQRHTHWAAHYRENARTPGNTEAAPWVRARMSAWK